MRVRKKQRLRFTKSRWRRRMNKVNPKKETAVSKKKDVNELLEPQDKFRAKTKGQADYIRAIIENDVVITIGDSGTGKSFIALSIAAKMLLEGKFNQIIIARPTIECSKRSIGYLPGDLSEKLDPYLRPAKLNLIKSLGKDTYYNLVRDDKIKFEALEYMRGSTFDNTFMILEESQNASTEQLIMFITRIGISSKIVINGDVSQSDLKYNNEYSDLDYVISKIEKANLINFGIVRLIEDDIVRSPIIKSFLRAMN